MKLRKVIVPQYIFKDELGQFVFHDISILVDVRSSITRENFNQASDDFSITSSEIERMGREAAQRFFNDKYKKILKSEHALQPSEFNGIRLFLGINGTELSRLLNLDKSSISRIINEKQEIQKDTMLFIMEKMRNELETPGITKATLAELENTSSTEVNELGVPAALVAEWLIRKFVELEECITNLKLQKLLYYAQGLGVGRYSCRLINDDFYAWEHGPVVKDVYHHYKNYGSGALAVDPSVDLSVILKNEQVIQILNDTLNMYGKFSAWVLRSKTHCETPWVETDQGRVIEFEKIQSFFRSILV